MATLIVRKLDDDLVQRLKARAEAHGRSAEAEHRLILEEVLCLKPKMTGAEFWEVAAAIAPVPSRMTTSSSKCSRRSDRPVEETTRWRP